MSTEEKVVKTNGKRNRLAGHGFERECAKAFRKIGFPHVVTTRSESRSRDNQQIDLINKDEAVNGRFPFNVQCKNSAAKVRYPKILSELPKTPGVINVIIHKQTGKVNNKFMSKGKYVIMNMDDFMQMVKDFVSIE